MDTLRVRLYNVRFGDAILITVPDRGAGKKVIERNILIDVGNSFHGVGGEDAVFGPVVEDVLKVLGGKPLDLYIMTHEHMDHVQGLLQVNQKVLPGHDLKTRLNVQYAWLTGSSEPGYYEKPGHEAAKSQFAETRRQYASISRFLAAGDEAPTPVQTLMSINNPRSTDDCVAFIRTLALPERTTYIYRGCNLKKKHPFREAKFEIWAPEENTADYYGQFLPMNFAMNEGGEGDEADELTDLVPPAGVDAGAYYDLVRERRDSYLDNLFAIDAAANNTSVVFCLKWRGWKLLFTGDAELRSWKTMAREKALSPVDFLKVGHHGSHNATPPPELLDIFLPKGTKKRRAGVSTFPGAYHNVPFEPTLEELKARSEVVTTQGLPDGSFVDFFFEG